jgi:hypothetical protein
MLLGYPIDARSTPTIAKAVLALSCSVMFMNLM